MGGDQRLIKENDMISLIISVVLTVVFFVLVLNSSRFILRGSRALIFPLLLITVFWLSNEITWYRIDRFHGGTTKQLLESKMRNSDFNGTSILVFPVTVKATRGKLVSWVFGLPMK